MSKIISLAELNSDCDAIVKASESYNMLTSAVISVLYATGCRETEALERDRWTYAGANGWIMQPQKHNKPRSIASKDLPALFVAYLNSTGYPSAISSANNLRRITRIFSAYPNATTGNKGISSHRYRHNRIKMLNAEGFTLAEIKNFMGLTSSRIVQGYIDSEIFQ